MEIPILTGLSSDIYFSKEYSWLYADKSKYFEYEFTKGSEFVKFTSIKRRINKIGDISINTELYDLETPYGYGGPITNSCNKDFINDAFINYRKHCKSERIVSEFIRFHPFNTITKYNTLFDMLHQERTVVIVDLTIPSEDRRKLYSKTTRNIIKKSKSLLEINHRVNNIDDFICLYKKTMDKNIADKFYYFSEDYFLKLQSIKNIELLEIKYQEEPISMGFFMYGPELSHYHLSANNSQYQKENGNYLLLDSAFESAKEKGCKYMLLGGGRTSSPNDSLLAFKSKFSPLTLPFYIGGLDYLPDEKKNLNEIWERQKKSNEHLNLFQQYRA
ncbi:peptidoglycan bridge formation glycyltransferase FemA/FemB family protein [Morganella morganii]|uniref:peptidoglycan bridge formation glycyltransferase FemA/FemB family protein n=1 Tax=Morganella morganii TaxID=582 RepID=UPI00386DDE49